MINYFTQCTICHQAGHVLCPDCQRHLNVYEETSDLHELAGLGGLVIGRHYDRIIKHLVHRLKYGRGKAIAKILGSKLATLIHTTDLIQQIKIHPGQVIVTTVPTHRVKRYFTRGYNQAELLARSIASSLDLPYSPLLYKSRRTTSQVKIRNRSDRLTNILNSFSSSTISTKGTLPSAMAPQLYNSPLIILVDDIITTGATISECTRILHDHYPYSQVRGVCIARNR